MSKTKVICRPLDEEIPKYVPCKYCEKSKEYCDKIPEQPNKELMIVKTIQGLISAVNRELGELNESTKLLSCHRNSLILQALEDIDIFERTTLFELQKAFE